MISVRFLCWRRYLCASLLFGLTFSVVALCAAAVCDQARAEEPRFFRIGTAATAGSFFEVGGVIANAISSPPGSPGCGELGGTCGVPGLVAVAQTTQGSIDNLRLINAGQIESGLAQGDIAGWAYKGAGSFSDTGAMPRLRAIASLFPENLYIAVRADSPVQKVADLKGKAVAIGEMGSGVAANARAVLDSAGLGDTDVKREFVRSSQGMQGLRDRSIDAIFIVGPEPSSLVRNLAAEMPIRLIPIDTDLLDRMRAHYGPYARSVIPGGVYTGVEDDTESLALSALWVVGADIDSDLVYAITKSLWNDTTQKSMARLSPGGRLMRLERALTGLAIPLHPGAERFYREVGLPVDDTPRALEGHAEELKN